MSDEHPNIDHPELGIFTRASTEMTDGTVLTHDWYVGSVPVDGTEVDLMVEASTPEEARALLPRLQTTVADLHSRRRLASDAVVAEFSQGEPETSELDEAATDLALETIEVEADGTVILHLTDTCGTHFPEGYWPAVHFGADDDISRVTVES